MGTPTTSTASERVTLQGGLTVSLAAVRLLWNLERRGFALRLDGGTACVRPGSSLTATDRRALGAYRDEVRALVAHYESLTPA